MIEDQEFIACITKVEGGDDYLSIGEPDKPESVKTVKGTFIGTMDEFGLRDLMSQDSDAYEHT